MKIYVNVLVALMLCCLLAISYRVTAQASGVKPDMNRSDGSITVILRDPVTDKPINGITLTLYKVGELKDDISDGIYVGIYGNPDNKTIPLEDVYSMLAEEWEKWAAELEAYVLENDIPETYSSGSITVGTDGTAVFKGLTPGLYLVAQTGDLKGYVMSAFLVMLPMMEGDKLYYNYNIIAIPKVIKSRLLEEPEDPNEPEDPDDPEDPNDSDDPGGSEEVENAETWQRLMNSDDDAKLPQTGQLWWPVTVMSVTGLLCCGMGYRLKRSHERLSHRKRR